MRATPLLLWLYLLNAAVLITHEIDSAYWHEWDLFGIPGGIQFFLVLKRSMVIFSRCRAASPALSAELQTRPQCGS